MSNDGFHVSSHTMQILGWESLRHHLSGFASSELGRDRCLEILWASDPEAVERALDETSEARTLIEARSALSLEGVHDINPHIRRLEKDGSLSGPELLQIASTLRAGVDAQITLEANTNRFPLLSARAPDAQGLADLVSIISDCIEPDGSVSDHASPELEALRAESLSISERISDRISGYLNSPDYAKALQDNFYTIKRDRFVLPIRADARGRIDGIVQDSSSSGATLFIEPREIVDLNNQLVIANLAVEAERARILREISADLAAETESLEAILIAVVALDVIQARARFSIRLDAARPEIEPEGSFRLIGARHPLLALATDQVVPNDVSIGPGFNTLIITGPNTGGKTVTLKTLGLCALMVRAGLHIPALPDSIVPLYRRIFADIGDEQSVERNLSTFSGHIRNITEIIDEADDRSLVLLDELIVGTDPFEGASLAEA
ncbi:endonuclease MutS2, partial [Thermodesulfobacteriota bacterium]